MSALVLLMALLGCKKGASSEGVEMEGELKATQPADRHTFRISQPRDAKGADLSLKIFTDQTDCRNAGIQDVAFCEPLLDRRSGQVRLAFQPRYEGATVALPLTSEHIQVIHDHRRVEDGTGASRVEIIPHDPVTDGARLYILLIDGSGSMRETGSRSTSRIERVRNALSREDVIARFFPADEETGVVLLSFSSGQPVPVGGELRVIRGPKRFERLVGELQVRNGYTHLYDAVEYATDGLLEEPAVRQYMDKHNAQPVVVVLTDGFNNEDDIRQGKDVCADNAPRLGELLMHIDERRDLATRDVDSIPVLYAVGLGKELPGSKKRIESVSARVTDVSARDLCGRFELRRIDGDLEREGIDEVSLEWIARHGGGFAFVKQHPRGLAEAFSAAAAIRYRWYEVRYRVDPQYLKRRFEVTLELTALAQASAMVAIQPSAWMDPPAGLYSLDPALEGWVERSPYGRSAGFVMALLGGAVALAFFGATLFNVTRIATGRRRPRKWPSD